MFDHLRRRVALLIFPNLDKPDDGSTQRSEVPVGFFDPEAARKFGISRRELLDAERARLQKEALTKEPFFTPEDLAELSGKLRDCRLERAKQIIEVVQAVQLHRLGRNPDFSLEDATQRLAKLIW